MNKLELEDYENIIDQIKSFEPTSGNFKSMDNASYIEGDALGEGTWKGVHYSSDELREGTDTLEGSPLVIGHGKDDQDKVGKVVESTWNPDRKVIEFRAEIESDDVVQMIKRGVVDSVSVGVEYDGKKEAKDIMFYELALVKEPAFVDGIKKLINQKMDKKGEDKDNELTGGEPSMDDKSDKRVILMHEDAYDELSSEEGTKILASYPGPSGYYPSPESSSGLTSSFKEIFRRLDKLAEEVGVDFETKYPYPKPGYPEAENDESENEYPYPYPYPGIKRYPYPKAGKEYPYPYPYPYPYAYPRSEQEENSGDILAVEVDEDKAKNIIDDLNSSIDDLVDQVGYPGPDSDIAKSLENIDKRLSDLEKELGL